MMKHMQFILLGIALTIANSMMSQTVIPVGFLNQVIEPGGRGNIGIQPYDIDCDQDMDLVTVAPDENLLLWYRNNWDSLTGAISFDKFVIDEELDGQYLDVADVNGDEIPEILCSEPGNDGKIILFWGYEESDSLFWTRDTVVPNYPGAHQVHLTDMDNDGDCDILAAGNIANMICWWENEQDSFWTPHVIANNLTGVQSVVAYDFNQDGYPDVVGGKMVQGLGEVNLWVSQYQDSLVFEKITLDTQLEGTHWFEISDINSDGMMDILTAAYLSGKIAAWIRTDSNTLDFDMETLVPDVSYPLHVAAADLDLDGDMDLLVPELSGSNHKLLYYDNDDGNYIKNVIREHYNAPWQMVPFDADNDHDTDFVAGAFYIPNPALSGDLTLFVNDLTTGFDEQTGWDYQQEILVYPNPFHDQISVNFDIDQPADVFINVIDALGKNQLSVHCFKEKGTHTIQLDLHTLPHGGYFVSLEANNQLISRQIIKY
jgi:hypothetical protein